MKSNTKWNRKKRILWIKKKEYINMKIALPLMLLCLVGCSSLTEKDLIADTKSSSKSEDHVSEKDTVKKIDDKKEVEKFKSAALDFSISGDILTYKDVEYSVISVDGGSQKGTRDQNVAVDIGFGDRSYWGLTNEYGQVVYVLAEEIILQDDDTEPVKNSGRYYHDEANVAGTERDDLDQGHVIADSLGGVSNAYNITPQDSTLNRHGDQAYMEKNIRDAGGCKNFVAIITYPDTETQIPNNYRYEYILKGNKIIDDFPNENPEEKDTTPVPEPVPTPAPLPPSTGSTVYWVPNGKSYHTTKGCSTLSNSKTILEGEMSACPKVDSCDRCH